MRMVVRRGCVGMAVVMWSAVTMASPDGVAPVSVVDGVAIPGVTAKVANAIPNATPQDPRLALKPEKPSDGVIVARFGETQVITIARDRLNRIVSPFEQLRVKIAQDEATQVETDASILYVTTTLDEPVSLYLHDARDPLKALSLVLVPKATLPVDVTLRVNDLQPSSFTVSGNGDVAEAFEREEPYVKTIMRVFKELAAGRIPAGFGLRDAGADVRMPPCAMPGLQIEPAQIVEGHDLITYVGRVTNVTFAPVEVREVGCSGTGILAVAAWPETVLQPRESSELYVAVVREEGQGASFRPRVAGGTP